VGWLTHQQVLRALQPESAGAGESVTIDPSPTGEHA
jgi:hypothetical protein